MTEIKKRKHPRFRRPNYGRKSRFRIGLAWRRPRGHDNKQRIGKKYMPRKPQIGWGQAKAVYGLHPTGKKEVRIENLKQLHTVASASSGAASSVVIRIAAGVGKRVKKEMLVIAAQKKLRVLNPAL